MVLRVLVGLVLVAACATSPQVTPATRAQYTRPLITDRLPFLLERDKVRGQLGATDWCRRRTWPHTDEFVVCDPRPYLNQKTPPMFVLVRYDDQDRTTAYAAFVPVPCRMYGRCDSLPMARNPLEWDYVDHDNGLRSNLIAIGQTADREGEDLPSMPQRMIDALTVELAKRFGKPIWQDPHQYGFAWATATTDIGMFVIGDGRWVIETHELRGSGPPGLAGF